MFAFLVTIYLLSSLWSVISRRRDAEHHCLRLAILKHCFVHQAQAQALFSAFSVRYQGLHACISAVPGYTKTVVPRSSSKAQSMICFASIHSHIQELPRACLQAESLLTKRGENPESCLVSLTTSSWAMASSRSATPPWLDVSKCNDLSRNTKHTTPSSLCPFFSFSFEV